VNLIGQKKLINIYMETLDKSAQAIALSSVTDQNYVRAVKLAKAGF
jgi:hypothetical protein